MTWITSNTLTMEYKRKYQVEALMTSSNGNIVLVTGPLRVNSPVTLTNGSDTEIWYGLCSAPEQTAE